MAKIEEITVELNACLTVTDETAMRCLKILEIWQDGNRDKIIIGEKKEDGSTVFSIKKLGGE